MTDLRTREAIRYLGYGRSAVDENVLALIADSFRELDGCAVARSVYRIFDLEVCRRETGAHQPEKEDAGRLQIGTMVAESRSLTRNLLGCREVVIFGATLGPAVDVLIRRYSLTEMARAVVLQACAAAFLEEYCDQIQKEIGEVLAKEGKYLRPRFSPGYGDFDIHHQEDILRMLDTAKKIGLTMTDSYMLTPTKSVTALIGISTTKENCHIKGCEACGKQDCPYRRK
ncbi:vitamin B12 dependent-methionine synthase activation domain-containing protein [Roseburia hominis]